MANRDVYSGKRSVRGSRLARTKLFSLALLSALNVDACADGDTEVADGAGGNDFRQGGTGNATRGGSSSGGLAQDGGIGATSNGGRGDGPNGGQSGERNVAGGGAGAEGGSSAAGAGNAGNFGGNSGGSAGEGEAGAGGAWQECAAARCGRYGHCSSLDQPSCICSVGFSGEHCDVDVNECEPQNPCPGACTNTSGSFSCECPVGFAGIHCEHRIFQGIGMLAGDTSSSVAALSRDGKHLVGTSLGTSTHSAVSFDIANATLQNVNPSGATACDGHAISGDGSVVIGRCEKTFRFSAGSATYFDNEVADARVTEVSADANVLVGVWPAAANWETGRAFRATPSTFTLLPCPDDSRGSKANSVSADGSLVALQCGASNLAFRWSLAEGAMPLPRSFWPWDTVSAYTATHVCSDGLTIVGYIDIGIDGNIVVNGAAGYWKDGQGTLTNYGQPSGCSADGRVQVGNTTTTRWPGAATVAQRIYIDDGTLANPLTAIVNSPDAQGWTLNHIAGISDDGKVIAGDGTHDGHNEGWVAHLP